MFVGGPFSATRVLLGGLKHKIPFELNATRKANVRARLKQVDKVVDVLRNSGVYLRALQEYDQPKEHEMLPINKYFVVKRRSERVERVGVHRIPKFTKVPIPRYQSIEAPLGRAQ